MVCVASRPLQSRLESASLKNLYLKKNPRPGRGTSVSPHLLLKSYRSYLLDAYEVEKDASFQANLCTKSHYANQLAPCHGLCGLFRCRWMMRHPYPPATPCSANHLRQAKTESAMHSCVPLLVLQRHWTPYPSTTHMQRTYNAHGSYGLSMAHIQRTYDA